MDLRQIQSGLEYTYEVCPGLNVTDFVTCDAALARAVEPTARFSEEKLLVYQQEEELLVSLYLDEGLLDRLAQDDPICQLHDGNLVDLCLAVEGVSHFLYLTWNAAHHKPVTALELETQAEVDKFITIAQLLLQQGHGHSHRLHPWLFREARFDENLTPLEQRRYRRANEIAARYCKQLETSLLEGGSRFAADLYADLRRFYRLSYEKKIHHLESAALR